MELEKVDEHRKSLPFHGLEMRFDYIGAFALKQVKVAVASLGTVGTELLGVVVLVKLVPEVVVAVVGKWRFEVEVVATGSVVVGGSMPFQEHSELPLMASLVPFAAEIQFVECKLR